MTRARRLVTLLALSAGAYALWIRLPGVDAKRQRLVRVVALDPERFLGLRAPIDLRGGRPFDTAGPRPRFYMDALWGFQLKELPERRTRLVVSGYAAARPRFLQVIADLLFWEPAHRIMQTRQFANLKRRAEREVLRPRSSA